jgi:hypothetical protein
MRQVFSYVCRRFAASSATGLHNSFQSGSHSLQYCFVADVFCMLKRLKQASSTLATSMQTFSAGLQICSKYEQEVIFLSIKRSLLLLLE